MQVQLRKKQEELSLISRLKATLTNSVVHRKKLFRVFICHIEVYDYTRECVRELEAAEETLNCLLQHFLFSETSTYDRKDGSKDSADISLGKVKRQQNLRELIAQESVVLVDTVI